MSEFTETKNIYFYGNPDSKTVLLQMVDDHDLSLIDQEVEHIRNLTKNANFLLTAIKVDNWNADLSPWPAPPVFGNEAFGEGAKDTLACLLGEVLPSLLGKTIAGSKDRTFYIGGYSLAGLFALWAAYQTDMFDGVAAASPSVWFPGFLEYAGEHSLRADRVYLSLGDNEEKTRHPVMAGVGEAIRAMDQHLKLSGTDCTLEWNAGNHFRDPDLRTAKGFAWLINGKAHD